MRAAKKIIHDHRHLIADDNDMAGEDRMANSN
jgi:hypothetical protein